jgi:hypothetical protein
MSDPVRPREHLTRYVIASFCGHLVWETLQLPLYTVWYEGGAWQIAFAVVHCTIGDVLIAVSALALALLLFGLAWPRSRSEYQSYAAAVVVLGLAYTVYSEWLNVNVRGTWSYSAWMPRIPPLGTGLSPLMQWIVVPACAVRWAFRGVSP